MQLSGFGGVGGGWEVSLLYSQSSPVFCGKSHYIVNYSGEDSLYSQCFSGSLTIELGEILLHHRGDLGHIIIEIEGDASTKCVPTYLKT